MSIVVGVGVQMTSRYVIFFNNVTFRRLYTLLSVQQTGFDVNVNSVYVR